MFYIRLLSQPFSFQERLCIKTVHCNFFSPHSQSPLHALLSSRLETASINSAYDHLLLKKRHSSKNSNPPELPDTCPRYYSSHGVLPEPFCHLLPVCLHTVAELLYLCYSVYVFHITLWLLHRVMLLLQYLFDTCQKVKLKSLLGEISLLFFHNQHVLLTVYFLQKCVLSTFDLCSDYIIKLLC